MGLLAILEDMSFFLGAATSILLLILSVAILLARRSSDKAKAVTVLVLGDIGRSPRMQYHALSLAKHGCYVSLVGYPGAQCLEEVAACPEIRICHLVPWAPPSSLPFTIRAVLRVASLCAQLLLVLMYRTPRPRLLLMQTPPAIPSLLVALAVAKVRGSALVVDFHNFGYSLLALKLGEHHPLVRAHLAYERFLGKFANSAFCVTEAMRKFLVAWDVSATTLHDRPAAIFKPTPLGEQHPLFERLRADGTLKILEPWWPTSGGAGLFTTVDAKSGAVTATSGRPRIVVSSTSWTPDEDFNQLLDALPALDARLAAAGERAVVLVTGKGDLRSAFEKRAAEMADSLKAIRVGTLWLSFADYAGILGSADLGLSLHTSSSGLDLPMKVVDMFGAGLPVCARDFPALPELVRHGENGFSFNDSAEELANSVARGLGLGGLEGVKDAAAIEKEVAALRKEAGVFREHGWDERWHEVAWPVLERWINL
eukprot:gnl/TRDRNA2_/TRDRNA2_126531_c0_seq1.p1 gnl/TRDRNA2_/TRDRNA2_126531_c0~~gnl/TRDRNA2_/TRDRNA2_126531_c0_seq1.p1  ORF type:complete len:505 (+),score=65.07 gnl/TRDRNA2_/TRDRNA2_126531_c0_seq1:68-1516(+)